MVNRRINELRELIHQACQNGVSLEEIVEAILEDLVEIVKEDNPHFTNEDAHQYANNFIKKIIEKTGYL